MPSKEQIKIDALKFLRENITAVVATSFNDEPRASTVYYFVDDDFIFYFITKRNTSKYLNIEMNPIAAFVVGTGPEHITVQAVGRAEIVVGDEDVERIAKELMEIRAREHIKMWPIEELYKFKDRNKVIFKMTPDKMFYMNIDSGAHPETVSDDYMQIIP